MLRADIIIPPRSDSGSGNAAVETTQRNQHIAAIEKHGRIGWQVSILASTTDEASLRLPRCIVTKPSLDGDSSPGLCPVSRSKQRLDATR